MPFSDPGLGLVNLLTNVTELQQYQCFGTAVVQSRWMILPLGAVALSQLQQHFFVHLASDGVKAG